MTKSSKLLGALRAAALAGVLISPGLVRAADAVPAHYQELYFDAAREGRVDLLQGMVKDSMPIDAHNGQGYTALILAAYDGQLEAVNFLIGKGADPCAVDPKGNSALMGVAFKGEIAVAQALVPRCDVNATNHVGQTAVMMASLFGHKDMVRLLSEHGAKLGLKDASGNTAQGLAHQQGNAEMEALLAELQR
ncbi:MAG: ankyrin repeat domain-containing protein [Caulobacteraceae bacterium]